MKLTLLSLTVVFLLNCGASPSPIPATEPIKEGNAPVHVSYTIETPDQVYQLPSILNEVSGITDLDSTHVAVVQDEKGIVFIFDLLKGRIIHQFSFDSIGDFEGITYTDSSLFILRSDGRLTEWENFNMNTGSGNIRHYNLALQTNDNEGLCYDETNKRLLISAKSKPDNIAEKSERYIYAFDLAKSELLPQPAYKINVEKLSAFATETGYSTSKSPKGKSKAFNFRPSSLSIHPATGELYVLSATDEIMIVFDTTGNPLRIFPLTQSHFTKPEGITFLPDNTMLISNEADGKVATILKYSLK